MGPLNLAVPTEYDPYLRISTRSWKCDSWRRLAYPPAPAPISANHFEGSAPLTIEGPLATLAEKARPSR